MEVGRPLQGLQKAAASQEALGFLPWPSRGADAEGEWQSRMQAAPIKTLSWSQGRAGFPAASPTSAASSFLLGTPASPAPWPSLSRPQVSAATQSQQGGPSSEAWPLCMWTAHLRPSGLAWPWAWAPLSASAQSPLRCSLRRFWPRLPALLRKEVPFRLLFPSCWDLAQACRTGLQGGLCLPSSQASFLTKI